MAHLKVEVDGTVTFEGEVPDQYLPSQPSMFPRALGFEGAKTGRPPPLGRLTMFTAVLELLRRGLEGSPMLQPITATVRTLGIGRAEMTIDMDMPDMPTIDGPIAL